MKMILADCFTPTMAHAVEAILWAIAVGVMALVARLVLALI